jgi:hypothetical protein
MYKGQSIQHKVTKEELFIVSGIFFSTLTALTLLPQPSTSHHFAIHINISHKLAFFLPSLLCTTLHFSSYHFTTFLDTFQFTTLLDDFHLTLHHFPYTFGCFPYTFSSLNSPQLSLSRIHTQLYMYKHQMPGHTYVSSHRRHNFSTNQCCSLATNSTCTICYFTSAWHHILSRPQTRCSRDS